MVRALFAISILQVAAIVLLYVKLADIEQSLERPAAATTTNLSPFNQQSRRTDGGVDEEQLRHIIREEIRAGLGRQPPVESAVAQSPAPVPQDPVEAERQREQVLQQIDYFSSVGRISDAEMLKLQSDIARLDPAARTEALGTLNRAINSGQLEGRL